jgi:adiponectin receptor
MRSPLLMKGRTVGDGGDREGDVIVKCCRRRCEFVSYDKLPDFLKHNEFIVDYYHSEWPVKEALLSAFSIVHPQ